MTLTRTSYEPGLGRDLIQTALAGSGLVLSCATRLTSPVDEWEACSHRLLKYSRKDTCGAPAVSHIIFVSHTRTGGVGGWGVVSRPWSKLCHTQCTCCTLAYLYGCQQLRRGGGGSKCGLSYLVFFLFFKPCSPPSSSATPQHLYQDVDLSQ